jgi:hypothetical protein
MLWYCRFRWHPGTTAQQARSRVLQQHDAGKNHPEKHRGWYNLAGGGAGFLLIEADDPRELTEILQPYMDLVSWDVHAVHELSYDTTIEEFRKTTQAAN